MILDIEQQSNKIIVSYYDVDGNVAFKQYPIKKFQNWYVCTKNDKNASKDYTNWDGRPVKLGDAKRFNKFSLTYFMNSLSDRDKKEILAYNMPKTYFVDIETEIVDGFPKPEEAKSRILTFSIITPDRKAIVLGLEDMSSDKIKKIEEDTNEYFKDFDSDWTFTYKKFNSEYDMVYTFLMKFLPKFPMMTGWNFINYDWLYITNRAKILNIDISEVSMTQSLDRNNGRPLHIGILDYMALYDKYDRSVRVKESNALDYVAGEVLKVKKIKYTGSLQDLYEDDFVKYAYYNVVDSVLVYYIDQKLKSMEVLLTLSNITQMPLYRAASPVAVTESLIARKLLEENKRIGVEYGNDESTKDAQYVGAYVKDPVVGYHKGVAAFDFASLYPSIMRQFNISPDAYIEKINRSDIAEKRKDKDAIVCDNGVVYDNKESVLKKILGDLYSQRKDYKKLSYDFYTKAEEVKRKIKEM
tara:strand:- start:796 stop:2202 length:1407 start_codon:yes stop_codon:yes gene_type:complete